MGQPSAMIKVQKENGSFIIDKQEYARFGKFYDMMFERLMNALADDNRIEYIVFKYDEDLGGNTVQIYTNRCTLFKTNEVFLPDHSNDRQIVDKLLAAWSKVPKEIFEKEQFEGLWKTTGKHIKFTRIWNGYRFTDEECVALLDGQHIQFIAKSKTGENKAYCGILADQEYNGSRFIGFKLDGWAVPIEFFEHLITEDERKELIAGKEVFLENMISKRTGGKFSKMVKWNLKDGLQFIN